MCSCRMQAETNMKKVTFNWKLSVVTSKTALQITYGGYFKVKTDYFDLVGTISFRRFFDNVSYVVTTNETVLNH